jgi:hypothetical protein
MVMKQVVRIRTAVIFRDYRVSYLMREFLGLNLGPESGLFRQIFVIRGVADGRWGGGERNWCGGPERSSPKVVKMGGKISM